MVFKYEESAKMTTSDMDTALHALLSLAWAIDTIDSAPGQWKHVEASGNCTGCLQLARWIVIQLVALGGV